MGQNQSGLPGNQDPNAQKEKDKKAKKYEQPPPTRIGRKKKKKRLPGKAGGSRSGSRGCGSCDGGGSDLIQSEL